MKVTVYGPFEPETYWHNHASVACLKKLQEEWIVVSKIEPRYPCAASGPKIRIGNVRHVLPFKRLLEPPHVASNALRKRQYRFGKRRLKVRVRIGCVGGIRWRGKQRHGGVL